MSYYLISELAFDFDLQTAAEADRFDVLKLHLESDTINLFRAALLTDFGSVTDCNDIHTDQFLVGDHGLDGLLDLFNTVLDSFPTSDDRYTEYMSLFSAFAEILAKCILKFVKVCPSF